MKKRMFFLISIIIFSIGILLGLVCATRIIKKSTDIPVIIDVDDITPDTPPNTLPDNSITNGEDSAPSAPSDNKEPKPRPDATYESSDPYILELDANYYDNTVLCWQNSIDQLNVQFDIVFLGDSLTKYNYWQELFPDKTVLNYGYSEATMETIYSFKDSVIHLNPDYIVIGGGTNRLKQLGEKNIRCYRAMLEAFTQCTYAKIYVQSIPPLTREGCDQWGYALEDIQEYNHHLEELANEFGCTFIDVYSLYADDDGYMDESDSIDGLHLTIDAYKKWEAAVKSALSE